ncbi:hypothetical protein BU23DRAFT_592425 [Bimuria novae-zelandiae CBS 107.79]|uniref:CENP-V/GFA domain-containing protein n=1 Tax=Bimuria novae-zelandiae CBS 107.79 TaxID=1447943 RepID=A0A6A5URR5_9PLEO|nr:hypothetical protein BU23DRAFT_592425 [Bimuria novae-zelandiae CBS 107.79]
MSKSKPFPAIHGGCYCGSTRYRLETAPLFCHACHCQDCNKQTGSVFACFTTIETDFISSIGATPPKIVTTPQPAGFPRHEASCGKCGTRLWTSGDRAPVTVDITTGTLDLPEIMAPDLHSFIESKVSWIILPEGTKTCKGQFDYKEHWPRSSLKRLDAAFQRAKARQQAAKAAISAQDSEEEKEADKTPTAQTPDEKDAVVEDDEEFERRFRETEIALQQRLEKLTLRLNENEKVQGDDLRPETTTAIGGSGMRRTSYIV